MVKKMLQSMTGYGQSSMTVHNLNIKIDMKSVNHRYQETMLRLPREWFAMEGQLKKQVQQRIKRGRVDVLISHEYDYSNNPEQSASVQAQLNWPMIHSYVEAAKQMEERFPIKGQLTFQDVLQLDGAISLQSNIQLAQEEILPQLQSCLERAQQQLMEMRLKEGKHLADDLRKRLDTMRSWHQQLTAAAPEVMEQVKNKLQHRIHDILGSVEDWDEQRFKMEVAVMAERTDISEELIRLDSHLKQFAELLQKDEPVGRKLDFIIQEMNREINTIGSKANHTELISVVIEMKAELEKMREQVQNVQ